MNKNAISIKILDNKGTIRHQVTGTAHCELVWYEEGEKNEEDLKPIVGGSDGIVKRL